MSPAEGVYALGASWRDSLRGRSAIFSVAAPSHQADGAGSAHAVNQTKNAATSSTPALKEKVLR